MWVLFLKSCSCSGYLGLDNWLNPLPVKGETGRDKRGLEPLTKLFGFLLKCLTRIRGERRPDISTNIQRPCLSLCSRYWCLISQDLCRDTQISLSPHFKGDYQLLNHLAGTQPVLSVFRV